MATDTATCACCGLKEECTPEYIAGVRARHNGRWICGLCAEAVKDEIARSDRVLTPEEAIDAHATFRSSPPPTDPAVRLISGLSRLLRRSFRTTPRQGAAAPRPLSRSETYFPSLAEQTAL